ncbi:hypothetical protein FKM82_021398 [Ascaphus truei]
MRETLPAHWLLICFLVTYNIAGSPCGCKASPVPLLYKGDLCHIDGFKCIVIWREVGTGDKESEGQFCVRFFNAQTSLRKIHRVPDRTRDAQYTKRP